LVKNPNKVIIVNAAEDFGDECAPFEQKLDSELETHENQLGLCIGVLNPGSADIRRTIMQHDIGLPVFQFVSQKITAVWCSDISSEGHYAWYRLYWYKIHT